MFLCWGSKGALPKQQLEEIAAGLENSGHRFLWVVRTPAGSDDPKRYWERRGEADLDALLPEGFLERTKDRGLVIKTWAPQVDVLNHPATGAFVTHCGWNSVLETVSAGVPALTWPMVFEQFIIERLLTEVLAIGERLLPEGAGVRSTRYEENDLVPAVVVAQSVAKFMEPGATEPPN